MKVELITVRDLNNGYGVSKDFLIEGLKQAGIELIDKFDFKEVKSDLSLVYSYPTNLKWAHAKKKVCYTMFETDKIPGSWIPLLNAYDLVLVPTHWGKDVFEKCGVTTPIKVVNLGYNDKVFTYFERPEREIFTFLNYEAFTIRKGWHELFKAWQIAFTEDEPVRMIFKTIASTLDKRIPYMGEYKNIEVINEAYTQEQLFDLLKQADCFVYPSRGEGFGIPPLEAMATGIPCIAPNAHGVSEYFNPEFMLDVENKLDPARYDHIQEDVGNFVKCDVKDLAKKLREVYNKKGEFRVKSQDIAKFAKNYTIEKSVKALIKELQEL
jgi:glycosyltransferase involved in cell wall biosynthesis